MLFAVEYVKCWHPESPGSTVIARRRFRKRRPFATISETIKYIEWQLAMGGKVRDVRKIQP